MTPHTDHRRPSEPQTFAVVTGGGTAGHVLPALAVAESLVANGHDPSTILYVGCRQGKETVLLPPTPFPHTFHDVDGFQRGFGRRDLRRNLLFAPKMIRSTWRAWKQFRSNRPSVVVSLGGYASMPSVFAARRLGIPVVVVSYDRTPGRASKVAARRAVACAVAFENSPLPRAEVTGAPIRQEILAVDRLGGRAAARERLELPADRFVVALMGGSLGAGMLNDAIGEFVRANRSDGGLAVRQIAGEGKVDTIDAVDGGPDGILHAVIGYEPDMAAVYAAADLLVGRGGASTVHEVAVTGIPAILVPWSGAADDHQTDNVAWLTERGAAIALTESELGRLGSEIDRLRHDVAAREALSLAARRRGEVHRSDALARLIERVAVSSGGS